MCKLALALFLLASLSKSRRVKTAHKQVQSALPKALSQLNRVNFNQTVKQAHVDHWILLFCVDWLEIHPYLLEEYTRMAMHWEHTLENRASSWQSTAVRFGQVDCASDKALCNENDVERYPSLQHFHKGKKVSDWEPDPEQPSLKSDIASWVRQELTVNDTTNTSTKQETSALSSRVMADIAHVHHLASSGLNEFSSLMSWQDPIKAILAYLVLAMCLAVLSWSLVTGLELDLKYLSWRAAQAAETNYQPRALPAKRATLNASIEL